MLRHIGEQDPNIVHLYEQHKTNILNTLRKLILKLAVNKDEWQNLFHEVHMVCSWDPQGPEKLLKYFRRELNDSYIIHAKCRLKAIEDGQQLLKEYLTYWNDFKKHCDRLPIAFQQLDLATREALYRGAFRCKTNNSPVIKLPTHVIYSKYNSTKQKIDAATSTASPILPNLTPAPKLRLNKHGCPYSTVRCLMLKMWADEIINPLITRLINTIQELLISERLGQLIDSTLIINLRESFSYLDELSIIDYQQSHMKVFEQFYVEAVVLFYSTIGAPDKYLRDNGVLSYIDWALGRYEREEMKALQYLESSSPAIQRVSEACKEVLMENFVDQLYPESIQMIRADKIETIQLIFKFFAKISGVVQRLLDEDFRYHIITTGQVCLKQSHALHGGNPNYFVDKLLEIYNKFDEIVTKGFENDPRARLALEQAMSFVINDPEIFGQYGSTLNNSSGEQNSENSTPMKITSKTESESRCAEVLANYCNYLFRKSAFSRKLNAKNFSNRLKELYLIIKLLRNKEAFIKIHKHHLVRRLILDVTIDVAKEEEFINQLRETSGMPLDETNELLRMFKDLKASEVLNTQFMKSMKPALTMESVNNNNTISNISSQMTDRLSIQEINNQLSPVNIKVLNPSAWTKNLDRCPSILPEEISSLMPNFETFYKNQYEGREIEWCHQLSNGVVTFKNRNGDKYDLEVTAAQLSVLSAFDRRPYGKLTLDELRSLSELNANELRRTLGYLLANPKLKSQIMNCEPRIQSLRDLDSSRNLYSINHEFVLNKNGKSQSKGRVCLIGRLQI